MFVFAALLIVLWSLVPNSVVGAPVAAEVVQIITVLGLPVATAVVILKYRLYDIDRLINRTLVYGLLTALLAGVYAGLVLVLGQRFGGIGAEPPSWAVAGATLAVAGLFQPARRRIQQAVDRRFNRRKYDAARTIEVFSARLRDELDLDTLSTELLAVVDQTMQPTTMSLWLRTGRGQGEAGSPVTDVPLPGRRAVAGCTQGRPCGCGEGRNDLGLDRAEPLP